MVISSHSIYGSLYGQHFGRTYPICSATSVLYQTGPAMSAPNTRVSTGWSLTLTLTLARYGSPGTLAPNKEDPGDPYPRPGEQRKFDDKEN